nr:retinoic acid receptor responder protein 1 [Pogona vitticeps]
MRRLAASLLLFLLPLVLPSPSWARGAGGGDGGPSPPKLIWQDHQRRLLSPRGARDPSTLQLARVAQTAVYSFNYRLGSPSSLRAPGQVKKASVKTIPGVGRKYFLQFSTKDLQTGQNLGTCLASVFYMKNKPKPTVDINCIRNKDHDQRLQEDYGLYLSMKGISEPSLNLVSALASLGSSYIAWEKSTEDTTYFLTQVKDAKYSWGRADESLEFNFSVLLGSSLSESLACHMRVTWKLEQPLKVKYDCSTEEESSESADGSGGELGSTSGFFIDPENNF